MKKTLLVIMALMLILPVVASAQVCRIRVDDYVQGPQGRVYPSATAAGDTMVIPLAYTGNTYAGLIARGQYPDSLTYAVFGASDSMGMDLDIKFSAGGSAYYKYYLIDSLTTLGTKGAYKQVAIGKGIWWGYDNIGIAVLSRALGAVGRAKTPTRAWVRLERWFIIPPK